MVGLELIAGHLVAWGTRGLTPAGKRPNGGPGEVVDAELDRLHDAIAAKLGADPALVKLEWEFSQGLGPDDRTLRRVQDAVEDAVEEDPGFGTAIGLLLARLEEICNGAPSVARIDMRGAKGVQVGSFNQQTNTFR